MPIAIILVPSAYFALIVKYAGSITNVMREILPFPFVVVFTKPSVNSFFLIFTLISTWCIASFHATFFLFMYAHTPYNTPMDEKRQQTLLTFGFLSTLFYMCYTLHMIKIKDLTAEETLSRYTACCDRIANTEDRIYDLCKECGLSYWFLHKVADSDDTYREMLEHALTCRATIYHDKCKDIVDNIQEFWQADYIDNSGNLHQITKERTTAVNKARLQLDFYMKCCEMLCPMIFGDKSKEIKEIQKEINSLKDAIIRGK